MVLHGRQGFLAMITFGWHESVARVDPHVSSICWQSLFKECVLPWVELVYCYVLHTPYSLLRTDTSNP